MNSTYRFDNHSVQTELVETGLSSLNNLFHSEKEIVCIVDNKILELYPQLSATIPNNRIIPIDAVEQNKSLQTVETILGHIQALNLKRSSIICGIGGGITTDITAFVASIFKRGTRLWLVPTTVIAMADAAIGGKTAINFQSIKNSIGTFYPAEKVIYSKEFLETLVEADLKSGSYELLKMSLLAESVAPSETSLFKTIMESVHAKLLICINDLNDKGERRKLNLGHTFGHLIETVSDYQIKHGFAVGIGLRIALRLSLELNLINQTTYNRVNFVLEQHPSPVMLDQQAILKIKEQGKEILLSDKKNTDKLTLILFEGDNAEVVVKSIEYSDRILEIITNK
ncbi:MAG: 3-dehydroquinate synthase family protein [Candidatus Zophobacter franzmannii]|nr:3-dehydroquinate synthase family protein [Candidatus Zophobacter franzmannii]